MKRILLSLSFALIAMLVVISPTLACQQPPSGCADEHNCGWDPGSVNRDDWLYGSCLVWFNPPYHGYYIPDRTYYENFYPSGVYADAFYNFHYSADAPRPVVPGYRTY